MCSDESPLGTFDLVGTYAVPQGADWDVAIRYLESNSPVDFSAATAVMQVRKDYDKEIILELSTTAGTITLTDGAANTPNVTIHFESAATSALTTYEGIYDLEVTLSSGLVKKFIAGKFNLYREVTK